MTTFLAEAARLIHERHGSRFLHTLLVVPSRRAVFFLRKTLQEAGTNAPGFMPRILAIEDFLRELTALEPIDPLESTIRLYEPYQQLVPHPQPLETFIQWAPTLLQDFNELDAGLVDPVTFFQSLADVRKLEEWNADAQSPTETQENYIRFWEQMHDLYAAFNRELHATGRGYSGQVLRQAADQGKERFTAVFPTIESAVWIGFNALTAAEEKIAEWLSECVELRMIWDADVYYLDDPMQEAGQFLRKQLDKWKDRSDVVQQDGFQDASKQIDVFQVQGGFAQAKLVGHLLESENCPWERTAVILADEALLFPVLESLPNDVPAVNVTLGLPLQASTLWGVLMNYIDVFIQATGPTSAPFPHRELTTLLQHPALAEVADAHTWKEWIVREKRIWVDPELWLKQEGNMGTELVDLFPKELRPMDYATQIMAFLAFIERSYTPTDTLADLIQVQFQALRSVLEQGEELIKRTAIHPNWKLWRQFLAQLAGRQTIDLLGEPVQGLQVMGVLETRTLDFDRLLVLSVNEGVLPAGKKTQSFIPLDVKRAFGLPTHQEKDAVFAYHFYRMMQRARHVTLISDGSVKPLAGGEESRFIQQLAYELPLKKSPVHFSRKSVHVSRSLPARSDIQIHKTPEILESLNGLVARGLSPSALNSYVNSPVDFYWRYVCGVEEPEVLKEELDHSTFGDVVHALLQDGYEAFLANGQVDIAQLEAWAMTLPDELHMRFSEEQRVDVRGGQNLLRLKLAEEYIHRFIQFEKQRIREQPIRIRSLEERLAYAPSWEGLSVKFKGFADRIESIGGTTWILDYKTGKVGLPDVRVNEVGELFTDRKKSKALQLAMYAWLWKKQYPENPSVQAGIISFPNLTAGILPLRIAGSEEPTEEVWEAFELELKALVKEMCDPTIPFVQKPDEKYTLFGG